MTPEQLTEIKRIHEAVDSFASAMKTRLTQKVEEGYTGWDDADACPDFGLCVQMSDDALCMPIVKAVDIANRAMMLWWRNRPNNATGGTRREGVDA